jgi:hypothetical protein
MKIVSIICELGMKYKYPHPLDLAEILARNPRLDIAVHGKFEQDLETWNSGRGFQLILDVRNSSLLGLFDTLKSLWLRRPAVIVCFSPMSLLASCIYKLNFFSEFRTHIYYYCLELEKPSISFKKSGRLAFLLYLLRYSASCVYTTGPCRANVLKIWYGLRKTPNVILNAALLSSTRKQVVSIANEGRLSAVRVACNVPGNFIVACAGGLTPLNYIFDIVSAFSLLPSNYKLELLGPVNPALLRDLADKNPLLFNHGRVRYIGCIEGPRSDLISYLNSANMGIALKNPCLDSGNANDKLYTPNKVFDYIAAGIPFICSLNPDTSDLSVSGCCILLGSGDTTPSSIAKAICTISDRSKSFSENARKAYISKLNYEFQAADLVGEILS